MLPVTAIAHAMGRWHLGCRSEGSTSLCEPLRIARYALAAAPAGYLTEKGIDARGVSPKSPAPSLPILPPARRAEARARYFFMTRSHRVPRFELRLGYGVNAKQKLRGMLYSHHATVRRVCSRILPTGENSTNHGQGSVNIRSMVRVRSTGAPPD